MVKDQTHILRQLLQETFCVSLQFCPLEYLRIMSKQLERAIDGCVLERQFSVSSLSILGNINIYKTAVVTQGSVNSQSKTKEEKDKDCAEVNTFFQLHSGKSVLIFTIGSVHSRSVGCGACAAVLFPLSSDEDQITCAEPVGKNVSAVMCEIYGIILALKLAVNYCNSSTVNKSAQSVFVLCDSSVAIDMIIQRSGFVNKPEVFELIQSQTKELAKMNVSIYLAWIPGHAGIEGNEKADMFAKDMSEDIFKGRVSASSCISINSALQILHTNPGRGSGSAGLVTSKSSY